MKRALVVKAFAKINLGLRVIGPYRGGYHELETVMQQVSLADTVLFEPSTLGGWRFFCTDPELAGEDNLVCRAAALLEKRAGKATTPVRISLYKVIPSAAGLGGGSSDAAATLLGLNSYWDLQLGKEELLEMAAELGSDVPFCLGGGTALARGRGEIMADLPPLPFFWVVIALPRGVKISTADAYAAFDRTRSGEPSLDPLIEAIRIGDRSKIAAWLRGSFTNTLETAALTGLEPLVDLKKGLRVSGLAPVLSGSGPALFMLADSYPSASGIARTVQEEGGEAYLCWTEFKKEEWENV